VISLKTPEEISKINKGGKILAGVVYKVASLVKSGVFVIELERQAEKLIKEAGGQPSFKGFNDYPAATCISINEEVVHGIPIIGRKLNNGDIVGVDIGLKYRGLYTDMAVTVPVGNISKEAKKLIKVTKKALALAIKKVKPGNTIGDIGFAVQSYAEQKGFSVVRSLVGHGVGHSVHEEPKVPNFGKPGDGIMLETGMVIALEPMINIGQSEVTTKKDGWTVVTADKSLSAHFEHTVAVTEKGYQILTK